jgi:signal peptidase I
MLGFDVSERTVVVGLFILTFLGKNFVIPSGSMENTLLIGDHLLVDRITLAPPTRWNDMTDAIGTILDVM